MLDLSLKYRNQFLKNQLAFNSRYKKLFDKVAVDVGNLANDPNIKFTKAFKFNRPVNQRISAIIAEFHDETLTLTENEIARSWDYSNQKNDAIVNNYLKTVTKVTAAQKATYLLPNTSALEAFISRKRNSETLSDAVWKVAKQLRGELEIHLGLGITEGSSAQEISQRIRQYLNNPEALFRRIRDENGKLIASKAMLENAPGQGVYNSAYKNALRVARTNTNQAYLLADHIRWSKLPMVIGVKISLSAQHKIEDICDYMEGDYPKDFLWVGWHPSCLCHETPVMMPREDFKAYLKGSKPLKAEQIIDYPENFINYTKENFERYSGYKQLPFWIADNQKIIQGLIK